MCKQKKKNISPFAGTAKKAQAARRVDYFNMLYRGTPSYKHQKNHQIESL